MLPRKLLYSSYSHTSHCGNYDLNVIRMQAAAAPECPCQPVMDFTEAARKAWVQAPPGSCMDNRDRLAEILWFLDLAHATRMVVGKHLRSAAGLTLEQGVVLCQADLAGGRATITKLAEAIGRQPHTMTVRVDGLERLGFVRRLRDQSDRRVVRVRLTRNGKVAVERFRRSIEPVVEKLSPASGFCGADAGLAIEKCRFLQALGSLSGASSNPPPKHFSE